MSILKNSRVIRRLLYEGSLVSVDFKVFVGVVGISWLLGGFPFALFAGAVLLFVLGVIHHG